MYRKGDTEALYAICRRIERNVQSVRCAQAGTDRAHAREALANLKAAIEIALPIVKAVRC